MKPNFALKFSQNGLGLLHRAIGGWRIIGSVAMDDAEFAAKLGYLRKTATQLAGGVFASKLVIPNSEILYRKVDAPGRSDAERLASVAAALDGATPYRVEELAFDWVDAGAGMANVAAVARVTLDEAENFATQHRFNPVSFVAIPKGNTFVGEPFFGETGLCATILPEGEILENDPGPIVVIDDHDPETAPEPPGTGPPGKAAAIGADAEKSDGTDNQPAQAAKFSTSRSSFDANPDSGLRLSRVSARFALYADKVPLTGESGLGAEEKSAKANITPMPVTAPQVAGLELPVEIPPAVAAKIPRQRKYRAPVADAAPAPAARMIADPNHRKPATGKIGFDLSQSPPPVGSKKLVGLAFGLGLLAMILLSVVLSSVFFDRPISSALLLRGFSDGGDELTAEPLTLPQIVETSIDPPAGGNLATQGQSSAALAVSRDASRTDNAVQKSDADPNVAALSSPDQLLLVTPEFSESELAESDPLVPPFGEIGIAEAHVIEASTGVWVLAPIPPVNLEPEQLDQFYVASIDRAVAGHDAVALPEIAAHNSDLPPGEFVSPAPVGTVFDLDALGFVRATPQGALSADGVRVVLGSPAVKPISRPQKSDIIDVPVVVAQHPSTRPTPRPANSTEIIERAQLGGRTRRELASIRPRPRPASAQQTGATADLTPTTLAVAMSRRPNQRAENFDRLVAKTRAAQLAATAAQSAAVAAAPRLPTIPITASVAREATIVNAVNLSQINLIGVYGASGTRRALVRLKNGRYLKVQIGDRLDGGKVAAIGGDRLQYIKAGRMVTLEIAS